MQEIFAGVRFVLSGFDPVSESQYRTEIVRRGGVDVGRYDPSCTHLIVSQHVHDDPICVAARKEGKIVVTEQWVEDSVTSGTLANARRVLYMPVKDINGIPGSEKFTICLTGYQRQERDDIMRMVNLMGARFSKPLIANQVTHLICYKFEGEKYELARKVKIKLVNHRWLEDCLTAWKILPTDNYSKSGWEIEILEAEARDSEEETEVPERKGRDAAREPMIKVPDTSVSVHEKVEFPKDDGNAMQPSSVGDVSFKSKASILPEEITSLESTRMLTPKSKVIKDFDPRDSTEMRSYQIAKEHSVSGSKKLSPCGTNITNGGSTPSAVKVAERSPLRAANTKFGSLIYSRRTPMKNSAIATTDNLQNSVREDLIAISSKGGCKISRSPLGEAGSGCQITAFRSPANGNYLEPFTNHLPQKRKVFASVTGIQSPKLGDHDCNPSTSEDLLEGMTPKSSEVGATLRKNRFDSAHFDLGISSKGAITSSSTEKQHHASSIPQLQTKCVSASDNKCLHSVCADTSAEQEAHFKPAEDSSSNVLLELSRYKQSSPTHKDAFPFIDCHSGKKTLDAEKPDPSKPQKMRTLMDCNVANNETGTADAAVFPRDDIAMQNLLVADQPKQPKDVTSGTRNIRKGFGTAINNKSAAINKKSTTDASRKEKASGFCPKSLQESLANTTDGSGGNFEMEMQHKPGPTSNGSEQIGNRPDNGVSDPDIRKLEAGILSSATNNNLYKVDTRDIPLKNKLLAKRKLKSGHSPDIDSDQELIDVARSDEGVGPCTATTSGKEVKAEQERSNTPTSNVANESIAAPHPGTGRVCSSIPMERAPNKKLKVAATRLSKKKNQKKLVEQETDSEKENMEATAVHHNADLLHSRKAVDVDESNKLQPAQSDVVHCPEPAWFTLSGHRVQRKEYRMLIRRLKGRVCRDSHQWSYQATHFIVPDTLRRTEKFFAAAASGRWILTENYLTASNQAGKFVDEEPYEWHNKGLTENGAISLEAPRKWRLLRERTGHGAFHGMRIVIYGDCISPSLDTLKRAVKAGGGTILATAPPYTRFLKCHIDYAVLSPSMPRVDACVQEFLRNKIPCVVADYLVEYVCKPGFPLDKHVLYKTHEWAEKSFSDLLKRSEEAVLEPSATSQGSA